MATSAVERTQLTRAVETGRDLVPWRPVVLSWLVSRALSVFVLLVLGSRTAPHPDISRLVMWDGGWYQIIAHVGYGTRPIPNVWTPWPFFPLYPALVRVLHILGSPYSFAQVVIANAAALVALAGVWRIARRHVSTTAATYAVWVTALFPGAITFAMGYPDSLFLAGAVWAFIFVEERRLIPAGAAALVATASRPNGFVILAALVVALLSRREWTGVERGRVRRVAIVVAPSILFLVAWCVVCWYLTGDPFVFVTAKQAWEEFTVFEAFTDKVPAVNVVLGGLLVIPFAMRIRRQPLSWIVLAAVSVLPSLVLGVVGLARYVVMCFPLSIAAGEALEGLQPKVSRALLAASGAALIGFGLLITRLSFVP
jgi:hypothetical protein